MQMIMKTIATAISATFLAACQTPGAPSPAVLESADVETMAALHSGLESATGRADVTLGPGDLTETSTIAVLPPPLGPGEGRSVATPTYFDLMWVDGDCVLVAHENGAQFPLDGVACRKP